MQQIFKFIIITDFFFKEGDKQPQILSGLQQQRFTLHSCYMGAVVVGYGFAPWLPGWKSNPKHNLLMTEPNQEWLLKLPFHKLRVDGEWEGGEGGWWVLRRAPFGMSTWCCMETNLTKISKKKKKLPFHHRGCHVCSHSIGPCKSRGQAWTCSPLPPPTGKHCQSHGSGWGLYNSLLGKGASSCPHNPITDHISQIRKLRQGEIIQFAKVT